MACFYACCGAIESRNVVKFGISKFDEPWERVATLTKTRDNPWYTAFSARVLFFIRFRYLSHARSVEEALKSTARRTLPMIGPWESPGGLCAVGCVKASGEWLASCLNAAGSVGAFFDFALSTLGALSVSSRWFSDLYAHAYERVYRSQLELSTGADHVASSIGYHAFSGRWT